MKNLIIILLLFVTVSSYAQNEGTLKTIKVGGIDTAAMLDPYKRSYPRQAVTLVFTTTGTSGASTMSYNSTTGVLTVNIPQYSGGGTNYWTASGNDIYNNNTANVGIGVTSPLQKLDVDGWLKIGTNSGAASPNASAIYSRNDNSQMALYSTATAAHGAYILLNAANPIGHQDSGTVLINYGDWTSTAPLRSLLRFRYVNNGKSFDNLSANNLGYVGINTSSAHNTLSVEPRKYYTGQASQSGATVTGVGTTWTSDMVGDYFKWNSQPFAADRITAVNSTTSITLALDQPVGNASPSDYEILRIGMQVTPLGRVGIGTASPTQALHVTGQARIDSLLTGTGSDSLVVVNNGTLKKVLQSSVTGTGTVTSISSPNSTLSIGTPTTTPTADINLGHANFFTTNQSATIFGVGTGSTTPSSVLHVVETSTSVPRGILADQYNAGTQGSRITMRKARGTFASPTVITTGDVLGSWTTAGHDGSGFIDAAKILVTSTGTIGTNIIPAFMDLQTMNSAGTLTTGLSISSAQAITLPALNATGIVHNSSAGLLSTSLLSLTADVTGILGSTNGGSGINNAGTLTWGSGGTLGTAAYTASTAYRSSTGTTGDLGSWSASNTPSNISAVATGYLLGSQGTSTLPAWLQAATLNTSLTTPLVIGNTTSGGTLTLQSTSNGTKGKVLFGSTTAYDEVNDRVGIGTASPSYKLEVVGTGGSDFVVSRSGVARFIVSGLGSGTMSVAGVEGAMRLGNSGGTLRFITGSTTGDRMYIDASGNVGVGVATPTSILHTTSFATAYTATATSLTLTSAHNVVAITATGQTGTLPTAVGITGRIYTIKLTASGTGTIATTSSQTIDGSTTYSLSAQYKYVTVQSDGTNWNIIANNDMKWFVLLVCLPTLLFSRKKAIVTPLENFKKAA